MSRYTMGPDGAPIHGKDGRDLSAYFDEEYEKYLGTLRPEVANGVRARVLRHLANLSKQDLAQFDQDYRAHGMTVAWHNEQVRWACKAKPLKRAPQARTNPYHAVQAINPGAFTSSGILLANTRSSSLHIARARARQTLCGKTAAPGRFPVSAATCPACKAAYQMSTPKPSNP